MSFTIKMVIPKNVESISNEAFRECSRMQSVTILGDVPTILDSGKFLMKNSNFAEAKIEREQAKDAA